MSSLSTEHRQRLAGEVQLEVSHSSHCRRRRHAMERWTREVVAKSSGRLDRPHRKHAARRRTWPPPPPVSSSSRVGRTRQSGPHEEATRSKCSKRLASQMKPMRRCPTPTWFTLVSLAAVLPLAMLPVAIGRSQHLAATFADSTLMAASEPIEDLDLGDEAEQLRKRRHAQHADEQPEGGPSGRLMDEDERSGPNVINGMLRGQVNLRCSLKPRERDHDEVSLILWYKDSSMVPIFSVDARASPVLEARHKPGAWLEGRSALRFEEAGDDDEEADGDHRRRDEFESRLNQTTRPRRSSGEGSRFRGGVARHKYTAAAAARRTRKSAEPHSKHLVAELTVESLSSQDNGLYKCKVDFRRSRSRLQQVELRVIVPAEKPIIRDLSLGSSRLVRNSLVGPHLEGVNVVLECETSGGYPEPSVTWWRDGRQVDDTYEIVAASDGQVLERHGVGAAPSSDPADNELTAGARHQQQTGRRQQQQHSMTTTMEEAPISRGQPQPAEPTSSLGPNNRLIRNRLELVGLTRDDLLANYSCRASNSRLGEPPTSYAMIDMNLRPIKVLIDNERLPLLAGRPSELVCRVFGARPAARISWHLNKSRLIGAGQEISSGASQSSEPNITTAVLTFTPQIEHSGKLLTCRAESSFGPTAAAAAAAHSNHRAAAASSSSAAAAQFDPFDQAPTPDNTALEDSWKLEIHYLPRVRLALGEKLANRQAVQVGHDVYFECSVQAEPPAHELRWWFEGRELEHNTTKGVIISNQSLALRRINRDQRGSYTCSALNAVGEARSNPVLLRVQHEPHCGDQLVGQVAPSGDYNQQATTIKNNNKHKSHYGVARGESVRVHCHVEADPSDSISFKWAFVAHQPTTAAVAAELAAGNKSNNQQQVVFLNASLVANATDHNPLVSVLNYTPRNELDYGSLLCWAQNSLGQQAEPCIYQVVPAERPEPPRNCRLLNATDSQLVIGCQPGYDGGIEQTFHMEIYETGRGGSDQLVANLTNVVGLAGASWLNLKADDTGEDEQRDSPDLDLFDAEAQDESRGSSLSSLSSSSSSLSPPPPAAAQKGTQNESQLNHLAANLINEIQTNSTTTVSKQQKQRHSNQLIGLVSSPMSRQRDELAPSQQAVFLTEPQLNPDTNYLISVYSSNAKGSSRPIRFAASTTSESGQVLAFNNNNLNIKLASSASRESRRSHHSAADQNTSALINEMLALSWSPFLLVCAVTTLIFILFASITFALIKYVDLNGLMAASHSNQGHDSESGSVMNQLERRGGGGGSGGGLKHVEQRAGAKTNNTTATTLSSSNLSTASNATNSDQGKSALGANRDHCNQQQQGAGLTRAGQHFVSATLSRMPASMQVARVIAIGPNSAGSSQWPTQLNSNCNELLDGNNELEIPLNGMPKRGSLLNGSYLRTKIQQLTSGGGATLKQSNSDNLLNEMVAASSTTPGGGAQNWFQCRAPNYQAAYWAGGTLPRAPQSMEPSCESSAYGHMKPIGFDSGQVPVLSGVAAHNHNNHHHHEHFVEPEGHARQQQQQSFVELPPPPPPGADLVDSANLNFVFSRNHLGSDPVQATGLTNCSAATSSTSGLASPIEHLLISGKQYIHQTRPISFNEQQQQQHQHQLQLTSCSAALGNYHQRASPAACCGPATATAAVSGGQSAAVCSAPAGPLAVLHFPAGVVGTSASRTAANCCPIGAHDNDYNKQQGNVQDEDDEDSRRHSSTTPKTSDLGEEADEDEQARCGGNLNSMNLHYNNQQHHHHHQHHHHNHNHNVVDSDGMSSQGTQRSSLTAGSAQATTLTSPSSGYGPETLDNNNGLRYEPLKPCSKAASSELRHTRRSLNEGAEQEQMEPTGQIHTYNYVCHQDLVDSNNNSAARFYLMPDDSIASNSLHLRGNGNPTLIRVANTSRVRLVTPIVSQQQQQQQHPNSAALVQCGPPDQMANNLANYNYNYKTQPRRATQKSQEPPAGSSDGAADDLVAARHHLDLQTDV